jgi:DNA-directed RNA polymerase subunit RPC12/RpoP
MPVTVACPTCGTQLRMHDTSHGRFVRCPKCGATVERPPDAEAVQAVSPVDESAEEPLAEVLPADAEDLVHAPAPRPGRLRRWSRPRCPYCGSHEPPYIGRKISSAGWVTFALLLVFFLPLCWIGLLMKEEYPECYDCGTPLRG